MRLPSVSRQGSRTLVMIRTLIIEAEPRVRAGMRSILSATCPEVLVEAEASGVHGGLRAIRQVQPDLVIMDIDLGTGSAFDLLELLPSPDFKIIFISSNGSSALRAFKFNPVDYLLKPIDRVELAEAVKRAGIGYS